MLLDSLVIGEFFLKKLEYLTVKFLDLDDVQVVLYLQFLPNNQHIHRLKQPIEKPIETNRRWSQSRQTSVKDSPRLAGSSPDWHTRLEL